MSQPYLGQLMCVGFTFNNRGWANCDGQLLAISQNQALFSLFGTTYGGDGRTTFGLPELRGRVPIHVGHGPGLSDFKQGEKGGQETVTLTSNQIPSHAHPLNSEAKLNVNNATNSDTTSPGGAVLAKSRENTYLSSGAVDNTLNGNAISGQTANAGGNQPHQNMQPYQVLRWLVALQGIFPSRN